MLVDRDPEALKTSKLSSELEFDLSSDSEIPTSR